MNQMAAENAMIEGRRKHLKKDTTSIQRVDFGAGSQGASQTVSDIARRSLKRTKHAAALGNLAQSMQAEHILELGTSLGLTTAYLATGAHAVTTCEGDPAIAKLAREQWNTLGLTNIAISEGPFAETIPVLIEEWRAKNHPGFDLIFIDGHHIGSALIAYVKELKPWLRPRGVLVCDDIHWSSDMEQAWGQLIEDAHWTQAVDFYEWGMLTANPDLTKEIRSIRL
tara:strand:+ start:1815 stop:2489 length:675 start_codon:yes stop_codon:yes gene_type:complete